MQLLQSLPDCYLTDHHFFHSHLWSCSHTLSALPCSFPEKLMKPWSNGMHEPGIITPARFFRIVREIRILGDGGNHIHAPAVHTLIHPEFHKVIDLPAHSPIFPVKVRLLLITKVQVILSPCPVISLGAGDYLDQIFTGKRIHVCRTPDLPALESGAARPTTREEL